MTPIHSSFQTFAPWRRADSQTHWQRPVIVGVVNVTPDSFSDGGTAFLEHEAISRVRLVSDEGADVVELGAESTRPAGHYGEGYCPVTAEEQLRRLLPALRFARTYHPGLIAIDTTSVEVASVALNEGAHIINDVSLLAKEQLARVCAQNGAWLVLMHARPGSGIDDEQSLKHIREEWINAKERAIQAGLTSDRIVFDPGIGFGKSPRDNFRILQSLRKFSDLGAACYVGASRKSLLAFAEERCGLTPSTPALRDSGTSIVHVYAAKQGAQILRVHAVKAMLQALAVSQTISDEV